MTTWEIAQEVVTVVSTISAVLAVLVSRRSLWYTRTTDRLTSAESEAAVRARVNQILEEHGASFERAFKLIEQVNENSMREIQRLAATQQRHEVECARDKTKLLEGLTKLFEVTTAFENRLAGWGQEMTYAARALLDIQRHLGNNPNAPP